jgi:SH3 domain protein
MKFFWAVFGVLIAVATASGQSVYINDVIEVNLRAGPGYDHKSVSVLSSGDRVDIVEHGQTWSRVRIADGASGWVLTRLLTDREPNAAKIRRLEQQLAAPPSGDGSGEARLQAENLALKNALAEVRFELQAARQAAAVPQNDAADDALARSLARVKALEARLADCQRRVDHQTRSAGMRWFLAGAGVLLVGLLIGLKARNRRSGLL